MSSSSASIPNLARSGTNEIFVQSSPLALSLIDGLPQISMLSFHTCLYRLPDPDDAVSTVNSVEKMFASFAPYPLRPPVTFFWSSLKLLPASRWPARRGAGRGRARRRGGRGARGARGGRGAHRR